MNQNIKLSTVTFLDYEQSVSGNPFCSFLGRKIGEAPAKFGAVDRAMVS
jgi:hypothetical protein